MAKGQISEDELRGSLSLGSIANLATRPKKDNPFRVTSQEAPSSITPQAVAAPPREAERVIDLRTPAVELPRSTASAAQEAPIIAKPVMPQVIVEVPSLSPMAQIEQKKLPQKFTTKSDEPDEAEGRGLRKLDIFTEKVSLKLSPEMRDKVEAIARELQRTKTTKEERITANTVMRVAINALIDKFKLGEGDTANNEEELFELVKKKILKRESRGVES